MKDIKEYWLNSPLIARICFWILLFIGVAFLISSFVLPPLGVIDNSVLAALGEVQGFASIGLGFECIFKGKTVKMSKGNTTIEVNKNE